MLRNLVKKFTIHNLNDGDEPNQSLNGGSNGSLAAGNHHNRVPTGANLVGNLDRGGSGNVNSATNGPGGTQSAANKGLKRGKRTQTVKDGAGTQSFEDDPKDSGTESDEELALTETNSIRSVPISLTSDYYASQQSLSASCRSSHCGSPLPDQDCNSWDSTGYESGISARNEANDLEVELPNHHYHTRQQFRRFVHLQQNNTQQISFNNNSTAARNLHINNNNDDLNAGGGGGQSVMGAASLKEKVKGQGQETPVAAEPGDQSEEHELVASPDSCTSSVDELESIYGSDGIDCQAAKDKHDAVFLSPNHVTSLGESTPRGRSSFTVCSGSSAVVVVGAEKRKWSQVQSGDFYNVSGAAFSSNSNSSSNKNQVFGETGSSGDGRTNSNHNSSHYYNHHSNINATGSTRGHQCPPSFYDPSGNGSGTGPGTFSGSSGTFSGSSGASSGSSGARRTPVKLLINLTTSVGGGGATPAEPTNRGTPPNGGGKNANGHWLTVPSSPPDDSMAKSSPRKKCRSQLDDDDVQSTQSGGSERQRPSLNFDKMREKMKNKTGRRKHGNVNTTAMKSKLRGWSPGYHLRSSRNECLFQPLKFPPSPPNMSQAD